MTTKIKNSLVFLTILSLLNMTQVSAQFLTQQKRATLGVSAAQVYMPAPSHVAAPIPSSNGLARESYAIDLVMDYDKHTLKVEEAITYPNRTNTTLDSVTLAVAPNLIPDCFKLTRLLVNNVETNDYTLNRHRLDIPLQTPLEPDTLLQLNLRFEISLPYEGRFNSLSAQLFGYTDVQANLVNWYPFIVPFGSDGWILHEPWYYGEYLVYPRADYTVNLIFVGREKDPVVAASSSGERIGQFIRYNARDARSFALSISPFFQTSSMEVNDVTVLSYYLPAYRKSAEAAMELSAQAVELFSEQYGAYPQDVLSIVQADLNKSSDFSGLAFISRDFYQQYDGTLKNNLAYAAAHTTAHQWWLEQVGNDPAEEPWLDEALATYSEMLFLEESAPKETNYWMKNRVDFFRPQGWVNTTLYESLDHDTYQRSSVLNGFLFLTELRARIGNDAFSAFLQDYYAQNQGKIATSADFFSILEQHTETDYSDIVERFFK